MDGSKIEWTDATWNPIRGCSRVSEGCRNCYAERVAARFSGKGMPYEGLAKMEETTKRGRDGETRAESIGPRWTGQVAFIDDRLEDPIRWKKPRRIFVNSMSDLFHENVKDEWIDRIFAVMARAPQHTFQILTKRPDRMRHYMTNRVSPVDTERTVGECSARRGNVWLGVSVENQETADKRIPILLKTPAAVRWISAEPLLGPLDLYQYLPGGWVCSSCGYRYRDSVGRCKGYCQDPSGKSCDAMACARCGKFHYWTGSVASLNWVVVGGESGPGARPFDLAWACKIVSQCRGSSTPVFVKQLGSFPITDNANLFDFDDQIRLESYGSTAAGCRLVLHDRKGGDMSEWPIALMHQDSPKVTQPKEK